MRQAKPGRVVRPKTKGKTMKITATAYRKNEQNMTLVDRPAAFGAAPQLAWRLNDNYMHPRASKGDHVYTKAGAKFDIEDEVVATFKNGVSLFRVLVVDDADSVTLGRYVYRGDKWVLGDHVRYLRADISSLLAVVAFEIADR